MIDALDITLFVALAVASGIATYFWRRARYLAKRAGYYKARFLDLTEQRWNRG